MARYARHANSRRPTRTPSPITRCGAVTSVQTSHGCGRRKRFTVPALTDNLDSALVGIVLGFAPWIVYWVLVGNVPFTTAVLVALAVAVLSLIANRLRHAPGSSLEIGSIGTFLVLVVLTFTVSQDFLERWIQPLSSAGILLVALIGLLVGRPFVREIAEADQ